MKKILPIISISAIILIAIPFIASALTIENPLQYDTITEVINAVVDFIAMVGMGVAVIMIIWAGIVYMTSAGNEEKVKTAKKTLMWAVIGAAILLSAKFITDLIASIIGQN